MAFTALLYAYLLGGVTFIPLVIVAFIFITIYTSEPVEPVAGDISKKKQIIDGENGTAEVKVEGEEPTPLETDDLPRTRKGWLIVRRTFEESPADGGYVGMMRSFLDSRSKDPKRSRPKDTWYVVLKGKVLYLYEDETMLDCEAAVELGGHDVAIYPENLLDGELFTRRNAICLKPKSKGEDKAMPSLTKEMTLSDEEVAQQLDQAKEKGPSAEKAAEMEKKRVAVAREQALDTSIPWFIFVKSCTEMEDWYLALIHASDNPAKTPCLFSVQDVFKAADMNHLVTTLDEQPDVIPTRWFNALIGRIFFSFYRTDMLESFFIGRLMKKLSKVKRPNFLTDIVVTEVNVGNRAPSFSKPMLKELTKEGDAAMEVHFQYKGEFRITIEATATINIGGFTKPYVVKLALAAVIREIEGNLLVKLKRPPSNRIWYAFTQTPKMVLMVEPIVSDRQITWGMILSTIESKLKEIIQESVVLPNMDDIAFFDSLPYRHRGGIWSDASRTEGPRVSGPVPAETPGAQTVTTAPVDDNHSTILVPVVGISPPPEEKAALVQPPLSAEELTLTETVTPVVATSLTEEPFVSPSTDVETSEPVKTDPGRRRSWFASIRSDQSTLSSAVDDNDEEGGEERQRGRTQSIHSQPGNLRSRSTTTNPDVKVEDVDEDTSNVSDAEPERVLPRTSKRSSSAHSVRMGHVKSTSVDSSISAPDSTSTKPQNPQTSPNSFLSTLKSRAGDKQALSNTAREAMRKWGMNMNWGLKKDAGGSTNEDSDRSSIGSAISSRLRSDNNQTFAQRARTSYAEVRAAVEERKNRPPATNEDGSDAGRPSSPIPIPENSRNRAVSNPWQDGTTPISPLPPGPSSYPESVSLSNSSASSNGNSLRSSQADIANTRLLTSPPPAARMMAEGDSEDTHSKPAPAIVHVQPKGKTMTIPGIHASHRGEIMSMGYNAPPTPSITPGDGNKPSILRLFKSPVTSPEQQERSAPGTVAEQPSSKEQREGDSSSTTLKVLSPAPPPLPPRTTTASSVTRAATDHATRQPSPNSTASEALRTIASKDEISRAASNPTSPAECLPANDVIGNKESSLDVPDDDSKGESTSPGNPVRNPGPPLPPRRTPTINTQP